MGGLAFQSYAHWQASIYPGGPGPYSQPSPKDATTPQHCEPGGKTSTNSGVGETSHIQPDMINELHGHEGVVTNLLRPLGEYVT